MERDITRLTFISIINRGINSGSDDCLADIYSEDMVTCSHSNIKDLLLCGDSTETYIRPEPIFPYDYGPESL